ncbi:MAG: NYN domain-containing protein [Rhodothermales bacterium]|nr:NYN domain-containing protein [Rhodothermales bacterium]MBO6780096.1 NYN domain-containing protein [Rhodothermales bacterium]
MSSDNNIAVYVDFENVALGLRDRDQPDFDVEIVLEKLLEKGRILVKNAYCDWSSYQGARRPLHEAGFVLVEIPHARWSGKNSADIRMVVDALDLCYTRPHIDVFALVTGDSDFTPLVGKLREQGKRVIGIGVRDSSSKLLIESCDDFWYYDEIAGSRVPEEPEANGEKEKGKPSRTRLFKRLAATAHSMIDDRGEAVWASHVKQVFKRKQPNFSEGFYGFSSFSELLEEASRKGFLEIERDKNSGGHRIRSATSRPGNSK